MDNIADKHQDKSKESKEQNVTSTSDKQLREAAERVYRRYGSDLSAFYRDIQKQALYKRTG